MRHTLLLVVAAVSAIKAPARPIALALRPYRGGGDSEAAGAAGDGDDEAGRDEWRDAPPSRDVIKRAPRDLVDDEAHEGAARRGEVYFNMELDPFRALASAAAAVAGLLRGAWASMFGKGPKPEETADDDAIADAWPAALKSPARAAKRALETGRPVLERESSAGVEGRPKNNTQVLVLAARGGDAAALGAACAEAGPLRDALEAHVVLSACASDAAHAKAARIAAAAAPATPAKNSAFAALAVPDAAAAPGLRAVAVYRLASTASGPAVAGWLARAAEQNADDLKALAKASAELELGKELRQNAASAVKADRAAAEAAAKEAAKVAAEAAEKAEAALALERRKAADIKRRAALEAALPPEPDGPGVVVKLRCPSGGCELMRKFHPDAKTQQLLDWADAVGGVDLEEYAVRKVAGDRARLGDAAAALSDVLGARALLECVQLE